MTFCPFNLLVSDMNPIPCHVCQLHASFILTEVASYHVKHILHVYWKNNP